ncbi:MAG: phospho-N-acetylmuramoyl-pentapeptide-transferase, partial [Anaerolineaceae bacterium]|nr:phospho-N-acetylmuramoyl-pentapeptide-transferase [Anaerolineaceae bacterium]
MKETSLSLALSFLAFIMTVIWGNPLIRMLKYFKIGKIIREEGPDRHKDKLGTPTMGGLMIIAPVLLITVLLNAATLLGFDILGQSVLIPLFVLITFGLLGMVDDWEGIRGNRRGLGMRARTKFLIQLALGIATAFALKYIIDVPEMFWPGYPEAFDLGNWYIPIATLIIVGFSNAVNFTDGLDGLAGLISATAFATYGGIALLQDQFFLAHFCFTIVGSLFGFLWFNVHPAELFMGDTGSLAIGATLATFSLMTGQWLVLP